MYCTKRTVYLCGILWVTHDGTMGVLLLVLRTAKFRILLVLLVIDKHDLAPCLPVFRVYGDL
jgi:hypothetical protein